MAVHESAEFVRLFSVYSGARDAIGRHWLDAALARAQDDPLIAATRADLALYPGGGKPPTVEGFRLSTRGFKELTAISHLGPAVASLVSLRATQGDGAWQHDAGRLLAEVQNTRKANSVDLWRNQIAVEAFQGREQEIADLVDYSCAVTARYLTAALANDEYLTPETLRSDYLDGGHAQLPVPINHMMVATFFLVILDISFRITRWLRAHNVAWDRAMVIIAGQQGRPTAGVTLKTSSVATIIVGASGGRLPLDRVYMAPHAPTFRTPIDGDLSEVIEREASLREIWCHTRATAELGELMYSGYPRYQSESVAAPDVSDERVTVVTEMPEIHSASDMRAMVTRLRVLLEDPKQLLSGCIADFAVASLAAVDNDPTRVVVPGLSGVHYPRGL